MSGKRAALVYDLAERLTLGSTAKVVGGEPLLGAPFRVWVDEEEQVQVDSPKREAAHGVLVTMPNGHTALYAALSREDAEGLLADARRILDAAPKEAADG